MANHFLDLVRAHTPDASRTFIETPEGRVVSYGELDRRSAQYAGAFAALGVEPGDRVALQVEKSVEAVFAFLGTLRAGAVFLPLNTAYTGPEIEYFLGDAEPAVFICDPARLAELAPIAAARGVKQVLTLDAPGNGTAAQAADAAADTFDGCGTGRRRPRRAALHLRHHRALQGRHAQPWQPRLERAGAGRDLALHAGRCADPRAADLPHPRPVRRHQRHAAGRLVDDLPAKVRSRPDRGADGARQRDDGRADLLYAAARGIPACRRRPTAGMRLFISGSAPLLAETHREWKAKTDHAILERYGMTETGMNTSNPYAGERIAGTVGFPLPGVGVRVVDPESGTELAPGEIGMIEVKGPNVFSGYWRMPEKTAGEFRDGWFITGDLGLIDARGYVQIVGRGKDLVITGGYNVYPKEIETEIDALPGVIESAVIGLPHADFGEGVTAVVVARDGAALDEKTVLGALDGRLAKYKLPKRVIFLDDLPRNTMGKVQKNLLRQQFEGLYAK